MNDPEPTSQLASMEAILESVAQPVWVVDHDGMVVFVNRAGLTALGYDELSELRGRFGHDAIHYKHRDGSPYPAEDCPMTKVRGTGESVQMDEDWFVRRDGSMFPVSYTSTPIDMADGPAGSSPSRTSRSSARPSRRCASARRSSPRSASRCGSPISTAASTTPIRRRWRRWASPSSRSWWASPPTTRSTTSTPRAPYPEEDCPLVQARKAGETLQDAEDWLVRKDGSIVRVTHSSAPFERPHGLGLGDRVQRRQGQRRAEQAARDRDVAQARAQELRVARRRIIEAADAARAQLERDLHDGAQQQFVSAMLQLQLAERRAASDPDGACAACARRRSSWRAPASMSCAGWPPGSTRRSSPTAGSARRWSPSPRGCRSPVSVVRTPGVRLPGAVEASVYFFVSKDADQRGQARSRRTPATVSIGAKNGDADGRGQRRWRGRRAGRRRQRAARSGRPRRSPGRDTPGGEPGGGTLLGRPSQCAVRRSRPLVARSDRLRSVH